MQAEHGANENAPHQEWQPTHCEQRESQHEKWDVVVLRYPHVELVFREIGHIVSERGGVVMHGLSGQDPAHMRPPGTIDRRMRITVLVSILVMNAVRRHPKNRPALKRQSCAYRQKVFHPFRSLVPPVREQAVITHANAQASRHPPQKSSNEQCLPGKEERGDGPDVEGSHKEGCDPVDLVVV